MAERVIERPVVIPTVPTDFARVEALRQCLAYVRLLDVAKDDDFRSAFAATQKILELSDQEIADAILVSRPTVNRWVGGKSLPHRLMRRPIVKWMIEALSARIRFFETRQHRKVM